MMPDTKKISRMISYAIGVTVLCFTILILTLLFYKPVIPNSNELRLNESLERLRQAQVGSREAQERFGVQLQESREYFAKRDSLNGLEIEKINGDISKVRDDKKIHVIGSYGSDDLRRAFANLERQYDHP